MDAGSLLLPSGVDVRPHAIAGRRVSRNWLIRPTLPRGPTSSRSISPRPSSMSTPPRLSPGNV